MALHPRSHKRTAGKTKTIKVRKRNVPLAKPKFDQGAVPFNPEMDARLQRAVRRLNKISPPRGTKFRQGGKRVATGRKKK